MVSNLEIHYFDLRDNPSELRGIARVSDILASAKELYGDEMSDHPIVNFDVALDKLKVVPQQNPLRWEQTIGTLTFAVSGQIPAREDVKRARQLYEALPRHIRKGLAPEVVFGTLPYLVTACKINLDGSNQNGTNSLESMVEFASKLLSEDPVLMRSFFCAHKERRAIAPDMLRSSVKEDRCRTAINLVNGLIKNSPSSAGRIYWHHARGTPFGMNTIFPNIFLNYVDQGILLQLGRTIDNHYSEIQGFVSKYAVDGVRFTLDDVQFLYDNAERSCLQEYGPNWKNVRETEIKDPEMSELIGSASRLFKRFLSDDQINGVISEKGIRYLSGEDDTEVQETIELFRVNSAMSLTARSLLDAMFYRSWGELSREEDSIAFGLDRDHEYHQVKAFSLGYTSDSDRPSPIVYARETVDELTREMEGLNRLALRQFWR